MQWYLWLVVNGFLFLASALVMTSVKSQGTEARLAALVARVGVVEASGPYLPLAGGALSGALAVTGDVTLSGTVHAGGVSIPGGTIVAANMNCGAGGLAVTGGDMSCTGTAHAGALAINGGYSMPATGEDSLMGAPGAGYAQAYAQAQSTRINDILTFLNNRQLWTP